MPPSGKAPSGLSLLPRAVEPRVLDAAVSVCEVVGNSAEATAFRRYQHGIQRIADVAGMPMAEMNYPPRILGDLRTLSIWEKMRVITSPPRDCQEYLRSLAGAALPLLAVEGAACEFVATYYPALLVDGRVGDPFAKDCPVGQDLFRAPQRPGYATPLRTPGIVLKFLPFRPDARWQPFQAQLAAHHSRGARLAQSLRGLQAALGGSDAARAAREAHSALQADAEARRAAGQIQEDFAAFAHLRLRRGRLEELSRRAAEFLRARYRDLMVPDPLRRYHDAVRVFTWQVFLTKACVVSATLDWPLPDLTTEAFGAASTYVDGISTYTDLYTVLGERSLSVLDCAVVRLRAGLGPDGLHLVRSGEVKVFSDQTGASWNRLLWLGSTA